MHEDRPESMTDNEIQAARETGCRGKDEMDFIFENMDTGFAYFKVVADRKGNLCDLIFLECNHAYKKIIGITNENLIGKKFSNIVRIDEKWYTDIFEKAKKVSLTGEPINFMIKLKGYGKYVSSSMYCPHEGCIAIMAKDITEYKNKDILQRIIMYFSMRLVNTPTDKIDDWINNTLQVLGRFYDAECSRIFLYNKDRETLVSKHEWQIDGLGDANRNYKLKTDDFRWLLGEINEHKDILIFDLDEIPQEAYKEKTYFMYMGYKSLIYMPIFHESKVIGFVELSSLDSKKAWKPEQVDLLKIACTMLASAIIRKESDEALQNEINELVRLKRVLQDSEEKYRKLTLSIQDAIILIDSDEKIVNWNKAAEEIFGYSYKEVLGKKLHSLITPPENLSKAEENFNKFRSTGLGRFIDRITETDAIKKDGSRFRAEVSLSNVIIRGKTHVVGVVRNITERKQAHKKMMEAMEAAEAANKAKSQFIANMSHEIRTPMNGIIGFLDLLTKTSLDSQQQDYIKEMKVASDSLMAQINDLLDFSKIEANKLELEKIEFNLREVIEEVTGLFSPKAYSKGIKIHAMIDDSIPGLIKGDPVRLRQVVENLVCNAVKFTNKGEVVISVKLVSQTDYELEVLFKVTDTGIGISKSDRAKLFEPFSQLDASTTRKYGGTGLGLTISEKIVEMMSGEISVKSIKGKGSTFLFKVGFEKAHNAYMKKTVANKELKGIDILTSEEITCNERHAKSTKILLVEDNETNQKLAASILKTAGLSCDIAENGCKAIEMLENNSYDLVLMDCQMPEMDGYEATRYIRRRESCNSHTKIIAMTANAMRSDYDNCIKAGMDDYISKPFKASDLLRVAGKWLKNSTSESAKMYVLKQKTSQQDNLTDGSGVIICKTLNDLASDQMIDRDVIYQIYNEFVDKLPDELKKMQNAIDEGDFKALTMEAHTLKGSSAGLRLGGLSQSAASLEKQSREGNAAMCSVSMGQMIEYCDTYLKKII